MLKQLENIQNGIGTAKSFESFVTNHRLLKLSLSNHSKLERFHTHGITHLDIDKVEERYLLSGAKNGAICIHDLQNSSGKASYTANVVSRVSLSATYCHLNSISSVQWYPFDTGSFTSSSKDRKLKIWDTNRMKPADTFFLNSRIHSHHMSTISGNSLIAIASEHPHAILMDPKNGSYTHELRGGHTELLTCVRWSPSCEYHLATAGVDSKVLLWDTRCARRYLATFDQYNGELHKTNLDLVTAHSGTVINSLRFTDDGHHLISGGTDCHVRLWEVASRKNTLVNYGLVSNNQYRPIGMDIGGNANPPVLFVPSDKRILMYDLFSGVLITKLVGHFRMANCCVYRSTTNQMLSCSDDTCILLWTPDAEQEAAEQSYLMGNKEEEEEAVHSDNWSSDEGLGQL